MINPKSKQKRAIQASKLQITLEIKELLSSSGDNSKYVCKVHYKTLCLGTV